MARKLRIALDCRIPDPRQGVGTAVLSLAKALSDSNAIDQIYTFIVRDDMKSWIEPYIYGPCKLKSIPESALSSVKSALRWIAPLRFIWRTLRGGTVRLPLSDGYVESERFDIVHFPTQAAYLTELPTIYQPHDLQHLHYPHFFAKDELADRDKLYRAFCARASYVCVQTEWTKRDVIKQYGISEEKVVVVPWGSVFDSYQTPSGEEERKTVDKFGLPDCFFFYPAKTWPHKNHEVILRALHTLKSQHGVTSPVFFTGASTNHRLTLDKLAQDLGISEQVHFLGFVTPAELQVIFKAATAMIFPSKFEGFGLPILEAFHAGLPVLASKATTLPEVGQDGALYFDPDSPEELAGLMMSILDQPQLRQDLIGRGALQLSRYSFKETAASFQALYERTAALSARDHLMCSLPEARQ